VPSDAPAGAPLARVRHLAITHEGADAATPADVSFDVHPGDVVLVLGPSGSGKSTLALTLNGLIPHDVPAGVAGSVAIAGRETLDTPVSVLSAHVAMVFQDPDTQLVTGTVLDEVAFGPENLVLPVEDVLARTEDALRRVGLWDRRQENPDRLSGGGRQRLAIAAALAMGSPLLVLDEPTANLDPRGIDEVYATLTDVVSAGDRAIVLVEHNLDAAVSLATRVVVLDQRGVLVVDGRVDDLRTYAAALRDLGVWLPVSTLAALRLRDAGYALDPLPLTPAELRAALENAPALAEAVAEPVDPVAEPVEASHLRSPSARPLDKLGDREGSLGDRERAHREPLISVRDLTLRRGRTEVLHEIDLEIARGEFVAIVGANGAGKTSLLQAIAGVVRPPRATVRIGGQDVSRIAARELARTIGFVFQNPEHQFITHTVAGELAHGGTPRADVDRMLARFGLAEKTEVHPFLLSGGEKRRLSVGTALIAGAPVLALDEPTFGQDRARADEILAILRDLHGEGTTILVVTHDLQLVADHAERTIVLSDGRVIADASTADLFTDDDLLARAGLRPPPLRQALAGLTRHPELAPAVRIADLPGSPHSTRARLDSEIRRDSEILTPESPISGGSPIPGSRRALGDEGDGVGDAP
jgi:energy-coupling factor transport system ATP-binding protein